MTSRTIAGLSMYSCSPPRQRLGSFTSGSIKVGSMGSSIPAGMSELRAVVVPVMTRSQLYNPAPRSAERRGPIPGPRSEKYSTVIPYFFERDQPWHRADRISVGPIMASVPSRLARSSTFSHSCAKVTWGDIRSNEIIVSRCAKLRLIARTLPYALLGTEQTRDYSRGRPIVKRCHPILAAPVDVKTPDT